MKGLAVLAALLATVLALTWTIVSWQTQPAEVAPAIDLSQALSDEAGSFAEVTPGRRFTFPADHGEHPETKTEWWYFTGNLKDASGRYYGYQLTFFRAGQAAPDGAACNSPWAPRDVMMAHFAVSDPDDERF